MALRPARRTNDSKVNAMGVLVKPLKVPLPLKGTLIERQAELSLFVNQLSVFTVFKTEILEPEMSVLLADAVEKLIDVQAIFAELIKVAAMKNKIHLLREPLVPDEGDE